ncbi:SUMF1/EgtB/PvdO family nonheme iron enzyme [Streptomyces harbinensis]|uniref:SUMF1/EgtB/PvdO family nonheme iron enzyme n=1 Tax=Streptomyces harbinensis TaxID=1176198 RepID=UPI00371A59AA
MVTVTTWTGREIRALRQAKRMSLVAFAEHIGVSERMVSKWEARGASITPRPVNQSAFDSSLSLSPPDVRDRFAALLAAVPAAHGERANSPGPDHNHHTGTGALMARVPEGFFLSGPGDDPVWLDEFWIDVHPVTNAAYFTFTTATGHPAPRHWNGPEPPAELADHPVVWVTWDDARTYATWTGRTLPTAPQWEKAARGPAGATYPWGNTDSVGKCNVRESAIGQTTPVHRFHSGTSPYGVYDLCGNVWEWLASPTAPGRYELKGSAFTSPFARAAPSAFNDADHTMCDDDTGFRCATVSPDTYANAVSAKEYPPRSG